MTARVPQSHDQVARPAQIPSGQAQGACCTQTSGSKRIVAAEEPSLPRFALSRASSNTSAIPPGPPGTTRTARDPG